MRSTERRPTWQHDVRWLAALLLVGVVFVGAAASSLARLTAPAAVEPVARALLGLVVGPSDDAVRLSATNPVYQLGAPLPLLPGVPVTADATEIPTFERDAAIGRVAGVLSERVVRDGAAATWAGVEDAAWREVLERAEAGLVRPLVRAALQSALFDVGVGDGTRAANWPQQAQQNPGAEVQPLVGIFVTVPPLALQGRSAREIGELVVAELARIIIDDGAAAARDLITNAEVGAAFDAAVAGSVRAAVHEAVATVTATRAEEIDQRLAEARSVLAGVTPERDPWAGLVDPGDLGRLSDAERRVRVLDELAQRAAAGGSAAVLAALPPSGVRERVERAAPVLDTVARDAHRRITTLAWLLGGVALLLSLVVALTADGFGRVFAPGFAWLVGAAPGLAAAWWLRTLEPIEVWPAGPALEGAVASLVDTVRLSLAQLAPATAETLVWAHLVPAGIGAAFVLIGLSGALAAQLRPSRRGRF